MGRIQVLVAENDPGHREFFRNFFDKSHKDEFVWIPASGGTAALRVLERHPLPPVDLVVLSWRLPDIEGAKVMRLIRSNAHTRFVLTLAVAEPGSLSQIDGALEAGADDCIARPVREREFLLRLRALLRRREMVLEQHAVFEHEGLRLDIHSGAVRLGGGRIELYPKGLELLKAFLRRRDVLHSREYLRDLLWASPPAGWRRTLGRHVSGLRVALGAWGRRIEARGGGYALASLSRPGR